MTIRSSFSIAGALAGTLASALVLASCASAQREDDGDRQADELGSIQPQPQQRVCTGRWGCLARVRTDGTSHIKKFAAPQGFGPADLASAYNLTSGPSPSVTIAIVDAFDYAAAESDLAQYRKQFNLPPCTSASGCFKKVNQNGQASPLPAAPPANNDWTVEAALDLDLASAACPSCKIVLVEANDDQGDGLFQSQNGALTIPGVVAISNSWGGPESGNESQFEAFFSHTTAVGTFVATGDDGFNDGGQGPDYPGTSPNVTGVGGTSLVKSTTSARGWTEGAWSSGGSACSLSMTKPAWQNQTVCAHKASSDVSAVGDPNTGLAVFNAHAGGWIVVGGTSASTPFVAGVYARFGIAGQPPSYAYQHASQYFDVTTGKNGSCGNVLCNAGAGWDGPTGIGTPNGAVLGGGGGGTCSPNCAGKTCGDDGCGGTCGSCGSGTTCSPGGTCTGGGACDHPICSTGDALTGSCDSCAQQICAADSFCCNNSWDSTCVREVATVCQQSCGGGTCAHSVCASGGKLTASCDSCAQQVCAADSFCCNTRWDGQCVSEVSSICQQSCN